MNHAATTCSSLLKQPDKHKWSSLKGGGPSPSWNRRGGPKGRWPEGPGWLIIYYADL